MSMISKPESVVVVGQGYVGLPLAMRAVEAGYQVVGYETNPKRVECLGCGSSYVSDVSSTELAMALKTGRYTPTGDSEACAGFDVALITVPTPLAEGVPDLSHIEEAGHLLSRHLRRDVCIVLESTTYPGTTSGLLATLLEANSGLRAGIDFHLGYSPERIDPGNAVWNLVNTPKLVSGVTGASLRSVQQFYDTIVEKTVPVSGPAEAELAKLIENTFRHVNIALVNELAMSANALGFDIWEALEAASTKPFGFMRFIPGPGVGGHCLPIDPTYLSWHLKRSIGSPFRFVELANQINEHMPEYIVHRLILGLNRQKKALNGGRVLLLGLAYKADTSDVRESPSLRIAARLTALGASVFATDPFVDREISSGCTRVELTDLEIEEADAVVLLTPHTGVDYESVVTKAKYILDTRHHLVGLNVDYL